jgi:hypothetical protein
MNRPARPATPPAVKPRRMFAAPEVLCMHDYKEIPGFRPYLVIPLTPESIEAMRSSVASAMLTNRDTWTTSDNPETPHELIELTLRAISPHLVKATAPAGGKRGRK